MVRGGGHDAQGVATLQREIHRLFGVALLVLQPAGHLCGGTGRRVQGLAFVAIAVTSRACSRKCTA